MVVCSAKRDSPLKYAPNLPQSEVAQALPGCLPDSALRAYGLTVPERTTTLEALLGYSLAALIAHLQATTTDDAGKTWDAYKRGDLHLDHIIPLSAFNLSAFDQFRNAWSLFNLRLISASENIARSAKQRRGGASGVPWAAPLHAGRRLRKYPLGLRLPYRAAILDTVNAGEAQ